MVFYGFFFTHLNDLNIVLFSLSKLRIIVFDLPTRSQLSYGENKVNKQ